MNNMQTHFLKMHINPDHEYANTRMVRTNLLRHIHTRRLPWFTDVTSSSECDEHVMPEHQRRRVGGATKQETFRLRKQTTIWKRPEKQQSTYRSNNPRRFFFLCWLYNPCCLIATKSDRSGERLFFFSRWKQ